MVGNSHTYVAHVLDRTVNIYVVVLVTMIFLHHA